MHCTAAQPLLAEAQAGCCQPHTRTLISLADAPVPCLPAAQLDKRSITITEGGRSSDTQVVLNNTSSAPLHFQVAGPDREGHFSPLLASSLPAWLQLSPVRGTVPPGGQVAIQVCTCSCCCTWCR